MIVNTRTWPVRDVVAKLKISRQAIYLQREKLAKLGAKEYLACNDARPYKPSPAMLAKRSQRDDILWRCWNNGNGMSMAECAKAAGCGLTTAYRVIGGYE